MSAKSTGTVRFTLDPSNPPKLTAKQRARLDAIGDDQIDLTDIPEMGDVAWTRPGALVSADNKEQITLRLDADVLRYFRKTGRRYQSGAAVVCGCAEHFAKVAVDLDPLATMKTVRNVIILGSGCAGNTAAIYTARAGLKPLVVIGHEPGGQLSITTEVENFPGFPEGIQGPELVENMKKQAERFGAEFVYGTVDAADLANRPFRISIDGEWQECRTLIIATGASARWLGLENEHKLIGKGVSSCATCDGAFYREKLIMVIGGGDSAMEEANFLTRFGREVTLVHRREDFRASKIMLDRARANPKIKWLTNTTVLDVHDVHKGEVTGVTLHNLKTGKTWDQDVDGFFLAIGHIPNTKPFVGQIDLDLDGYIVSQGGARTNITGVFHAGDVQDRTYRQAITAAGAGCMAAIEAERFLEEEGH
jgi:thioredoxin reductase (NADPH)